MTTKELLEKLQNLIESKNLNLNTEAYLRDGYCRYIPVEDIDIDSDGGLLIIPLYNFDD